MTQTSPPPAPPIKGAVCTIIAKNYLAHARILMKSVRELNPELRRIVVLADRVDGYFDEASEDFDVVLSSDIGIPDSKWFHFRYGVLELSTAVKPYALEYLLDRYGLNRLLYLDPDIRVYTSLEDLVGRLGEASILLTPHLTGPLEDDARPGEVDILRCGTYNLGFLGLAGSAEARRFLRWWQSRVHEQCVIDPGRCLFVDQRWVDLAPGLFAGVAVARDPGWNVAYWNLAHRKVEENNGCYTVNGQPLLFFHFSGFDPLKPESLSKHQNRFELAQLGAAADLVRSYGEEVLAAGHRECRSWPYAYGYFQSGHAIPDYARVLLAGPPAGRGGEIDPFSDEGYRLFVQTCNEPVSKDEPPQVSARRIHLTALARHIHGSRADLQQRFPDPDGKDGLAFLAWLLTWGKAEHQLEPETLRPLVLEWRRALASLPGMWAKGRYRLLLAGLAVSVDLRKLAGRLHRRET
jgi:hypothetical protein